MRLRAEILQVTDDHTLVRVANPSSACGNCGGCVSITGKRKTQDKTLQVDNPLRAQQGDWVVVENKAADLTKTALLMYGLPTLGLFAGYSGGYALWGTDALAALGAVSGLIAAAVLARPIANKLAPLIGRPRIVSLAISDVSQHQDNRSGCH